MTNTIRKHIWPVPLVASIVIIGALAAFLVLLNNPGAAMAQDPGEPMPSGDPCASMTDDERADHLLGGGTCAAPTPVPTPAVSAPKSFIAEALDNGARLSWEAPDNLPDNATVANYQVDRKVYHSDSSNPILENTGDATIDVGVANSVSQETWDLGLSYGTTYTYRIRAHVSLTDDAGETMTEYGKWSEAETIITANSGGRLEPLLAPPTAPRNVTAAASCDEQIKVEWTAPSDFGKVPANFPGCSTCTNQTPTHTGGSGAGIVILPGTAEITSYTVERRIGNGTWQVVATDLTGTSYTDQDSLTFGTTYHYRVKAMNNARRYGPWAMASVTLTTPPSAQVPQSPDADLHAEDPSKVLFTWDPPAGPWRNVDDIDDNNVSKSMRYHVERRLEGTMDWVRLTDEPQKHHYLDNVSKEEAIRNIQTQGYEDEPGEAGSYKYRVAALFDNCQLSTWAVTAREVVVSLVPGQPTDLTATADGHSAITLSWNAPADRGSRITGYKIEYAISDGWKTAEENTGSAEATYSHTGLMAGTTYNYRVAAINEVGSSEASETAMATTAAVAPGMPTGLTATAMSQSQIDLSWTAPSEDGGSDITGYEFEYSTDGGSTWSDPAATDSMTTHSHAGLTAGTTYNYRVAAINEVGSSAPSVVAMATTEAEPEPEPQPIPGAPAITGVSSNAAGSATITLTPGANATVQYVWAAPVDGSEGMWSGETVGNATSVTMTGLTSGQDYWFIAIAGNGADPTQWSGWSGWSSLTSVQ